MSETEEGQRENVDQARTEEEPIEARKREFKEACFQQRGLIEGIKPDVRVIMNHPIFRKTDGHFIEAGEMRANIMLAFRHLEDARMRLGKAVQACDGGKSCYPK